jgi:hypothetical protein
MKKVTLIILMVASILGWSALIAQSVPSKMTAELPGASLKWIHIAEAEFERKKLDVDKYTISVIEETNSVTVGLSSFDSVPGTRGSSGTYPGYLVEISKKDLKILRSNYVR